MNILIALGIPFIGTTLGAAMVFFMKEKIAPKLEKALLGFASGVMIAASVAWHRIFIVIGYPDSASALKQ